MNTLQILLQQLGLFVIYIMAGVILVKAKVINRDGLEAISGYVIKMALPLSVFINIVDSVKKETLLASWPILVLAFIYYVVMLIVGHFMAKGFGLGKDRKGIYQSMMLFGNIGFMAVPVISGVFKPNGVLYVSVFMITDQFMLWTLGIKLLTMPGEGKFNPKKLINTATVGIVVGMLMVLTGLRLPTIIDTAFQKIGATASPLAMIYIGGIFAGLSIKKYLKEISLYGIVAVKMLIAPIIIFLLMSLFTVDTDMRLALSLIFGMPSMTAVVMMANASKMDGDYALGGVFVTTVCGLVTLPCVCWVLQNLM